MSRPPPKTSGLSSVLLRPSSSVVEEAKPHECHSSFTTAGSQASTITTILSLNWQTATYSEELTRQGAVTATHRWNAFWMCHLVINNRKCNSLSFPRSLVLLFRAPIGCVATHGSKPGTNGRKKRHYSSARRYLSSWHGRHIMRSLTRSSWITWIWVRWRWLQKGWKRVQHHTSSISLESGARAKRLGRYISAVLYSLERRMIDTYCC